MRVDIGGGIRLFVDIEGAALVADGDVMRNKPTLLLLHGGPGFDHTSFKPRFSALADICQIVYYDHRGNGRSDWGDKSLWTLDTWADDVVRLCNVLGIDPSRENLLAPIWQLMHRFGGRHLARRNSRLVCVSGG